MIEMTWLLMWLNVSAATLNAMLHLLGEGEGTKCA